MSGIVSELPESLEVFDGDNGAEDVQRSLLQRDLDDSSQENEVASVSIHNFDCQLCLSLLCEPVTIACGHTFVSIFAYSCRTRFDSNFSVSLVSRLYHCGD